MKKVKNFISEVFEFILYFGVITSLFIVVKQISTDIDMSTTLTEFQKSGLDALTAVISITMLIVIIYRAFLYSK